MVCFYQEPFFRNVAFCNFLQKNFTTSTAGPVRVLRGVPAAAEPDRHGLHDPELLQRPEAPKKSFGQVREVGTPSPFLGHVSLGEVVQVFSLLILP